MYVKPGTGTAGSYAVGTQTLNAVNGVATFTNLAVDRGGTGYVLKAVSEIGAGESGAFDVAGGLAWADAARCLGIAAGLISATPADIVKLDLVPNGVLMMDDAAVVARTAAGA